MSGLRVILASASATRAKLLREAGVSFEVRAPTMDEEKLKTELRQLAPPDLAMALARRKALSLSNGETLVIGADQVLNFEGGALGKPTTMAAARQRLWEMRGKSHVLETAVACARGGEIVWSHLSQPRLSMRMFSEAALDGYCLGAGESILSAAGAYQLEALGIQLFDAIDGDYFSILGLPLLPLLGYLRSEGALPS
jgi:septum formation protein